MEATGGDVKRWIVTLSSWASTTVEVEAEDAAAAVDAAQLVVYVSICHQCARNVDLGDEWSIPSDADPAEWASEIEPSS